FDKVRSMKRALKKTISLSEDKINQVNNNQDLRIMIYHSNDIQGAEYLFEYFKEAYPQNNIEIQEFDPVIATHLGEKALGVTWIKDIDKM
ncbi:MAG: DegV family protein, partial [Lactobacillus iners]|nr:DegV family protein [Lactobacillus iners]